MIRTPFVSVILTTKNESKNITRLLKSISEQTYKNIETIVVDNKSSDNTLDLAKKFKVKIFNYGPERSAQRNFGAKKSKGKYLLFLDADMVLSKNVIEKCVQLAVDKKGKVIVIPETTIGKGLIPKIRKFEREMYFNEVDYEVPRFFEKEFFFKYGGYDLNLTGPEDYDLPYRMRAEAQALRIKPYIYHNENGLTLAKLLKKKYYYAKKGAFYAIKHPRLVKVQGTILFRKVYLKNWRKFVRSPILGISFLFVRFLETIWAVSGFISAVGLFRFLKTLGSLFNDG